MSTSFHFADRFPALEWQPSDVHPDALASISRVAATRRGEPNIREPIAIDAASSGLAARPRRRRAQHQNELRQLWRTENRRKGGFDVVLNLNMVHISPWSAALGLLGGAAKVLKRGGALILYGPWLQAGVETAPSNLAFDQQLRDRDPAWGLRRVEDFEAEAARRGFVFEQVRQMPANNLMLLFRLPEAIVG